MWLLENFKLCIVAGLVLLQKKFDILSFQYLSLSLTHKHTHRERKGGGSGVSPLKNTVFIIALMVLVMEIPVL